MLPSRLIKVTNPQNAASYRAFEDALCFFGFLPCRLLSLILPVPILMPDAFALALATPSPLPDAPPFLVSSQCKRISAQSSGSLPFAAHSIHGLSVRSCNSRRKSMHWQAYARYSSKHLKPRMRDTPRDRHDARGARNRRQQIPSELLPLFTRLLAARPQGLDVILKQSFISRHQRQPFRLGLRKQKMVEWIIVVAWHGCDHKNVAVLYGWNRNPISHELRRQKSSWNVRQAR